MQLQPSFQLKLDYDLKRKMQSICLRNKVQKVSKGLKDNSMSLQELPTIMRKFQLDCSELNLCPKKCTAELVNAALCANAEPDIVRAIEGSIQLEEEE